MLMLNNNPLKRLKKAAFKGLSEIGYIFLPPGIEDIESEAFGGLVNVDILKLSKLKLTNFNPRTFGDTEKVLNLHVENSQLGKVSPKKKKITQS